MMPAPYKDTIRQLIHKTPFSIVPDIQLSGRPPTMANSEFLTNKEQGDWAEQIVFNAINDNSTDYFAVKYGRSDSLAAGDPGFAEFYEQYKYELNNIGKKPDILIFSKKNMTSHNLDLDDDDVVSRAVAAIEIRSSSFLSKKYANFMESRAQEALKACGCIREAIIQPPYSDILRRKRPELWKLIEQASAETFKELDFRLSSWSSTPELKRVSDLLRGLKEQIKILHKRDYLSITPKVEDLVLVNRWSDNFNVRHYYLQVFFDKAYIISFKDILEIISRPENEDVIFSIEEDVKNQGKTTVKINVQVGKEILGRIDMPDHKSAMKELERGRLLFYVVFKNGKGYLDKNVFESEIINDA
jgi:hypothetical protein